MPRTKQTASRGRRWPPPPPPPLPTFHPFPRLPAEIRAIIWELSLEPRIVEIGFTDEEGFYQKCEIPLELMVSQYSRNVVARSYPLCFGSLRYKPSIRFNFAIDTLNLDQTFKYRIPFLFSLAKYEELAILRYLALDFGML
jgi:hypothetical protein